MQRYELEKLLSNPPDICNKNIFIWGTGNTASLYQEGLYRLEKAGTLYISGYVDNDPQKWGKQFGEKKILSPTTLCAMDNVCVLICSPQPNIIQTLQQQLNILNIQNYHIDELILKLHKKEILKCYDLMNDTDSKQVYSHIISCRINGEYPHEDYISSKQYFELKEFAQRNPQETFIDCGAFVGDSLERYIWEKDGMFKKIIAFEPDKQNYSAMKKRVKRLTDEWNFNSDAIEIYPYGLSDKSSNLKIQRYSNNNGLGSKIVQQSSNEGEICTLVTIDDFVKQPFNFLKADIESYEYKMLSGAKNSIKKWHPLLAICIYHNAVDLYDIPLLINSIAPEYKMKIRHYSNLLDETVLYAWMDC